MKRLLAGPSTTSDQDNESWLADSIGQTTQQAWDISGGYGTELTDLPKFSVKILICTRMKGLDESIGRFVHLEKLDLSDNCLEMWPDWLICLPYLRELILYKNHLTNVNVFILEQLHYLTILDLGHNRLCELPENLGLLLPQLRRLHVEENQLTYLPASLLFCDLLNYVNVCDNHFTSRQEPLSINNTIDPVRVSNYRRSKRESGGYRIPSLQRIALGILMNQSKTLDSILPFPIKYSLLRNNFLCTYCRSYQVRDGTLGVIYQPVPWKSALQVYYTGKSDYTRSQSTLPFKHRLCDPCVLKVLSRHEVIFP
jgi:hypothetical protein